MQRATVLYEPCTGGSGDGNSQHPRLALSLQGTISTSRTLNIRTSTIYILNTTVNNPFGGGGLSNEVSTGAVPATCLTMSLIVLSFNPSDSSPGCRPKSPQPHSITRLSHLLRELNSYKERSAGSLSCPIKWFRNMFRNMFCVPG